MKFYPFVLFIFALFLTTSCTEDYQLPNMGSQTTIVITGIITNEPGPYYVTVWENISNISTGEMIRRGINDARITITDSNGNVDELQSFFSVPIEEEIIESPYPPYSWYEYYYHIPDGEGGYVKFSASAGMNKIKDDRDGKYFTVITKGNAGQTYTLSVEYAGKEYIATDYMCYGTVIDSISVEPLGRYIYDKPDGEDGFLVPCLYFAEPKDEVNFYMFTYYNYPMPNDQYAYTEPPKNLGLSSIVSENWLISTVSDRFMPAYVEKYKISDGDFSRKWYNGTDMGFHIYGQGWEFGGFVSMYCITEPLYRYFSALSQQYYDDGAFSPSPASPPTNLNGGAQGCFIAASVSQYALKLWKNDDEQR